MTGCAIEKPTWTVFEHHPYHSLCYNHLVQPDNVRMQELAMVVDLAGEVRVGLAGRLEHDLWACLCQHCRRTFVIGAYTPWIHL